MPQLLEPLQLFSHAYLKQSLLHLLLHQISVKINQLQHTKMIVSTLKEHYKQFQMTRTNSLLGIKLNLSRMQNNNNETE